MRVISRHPAPLLDQPILWPDTAADSFYQWGGWHAFQKKRHPQFWRFQADGAGGGAWSWLRVPTSAIIPTAKCATAVADGVAYAIGGIPSEELNVPIGGIVTYNFTSAIWEEESSQGYTPSGAGAWSQAAVAPQFGTQGLIVLLGGIMSNTHANKDHYLSFDSVKIYDPDTKRWHQQNTTGESPSPRMGFCMVGVESQTGTFEM
jgi:hypothetical protein